MGGLLKTMFSLSLCTQTRKMLNASDGSDRSWQFLPTHNCSSHIQNCHNKTFAIFQVGGGITGWRSQKLVHKCKPLRLTEKIPCKVGKILLTQSLQKARTTLILSFFWIHFPCEMCPFQKWSIKLKTLRNTKHQSMNYYREKVKHRLHPGRPKTMGNSSRYTCYATLINTWKYASKTSSAKLTTGRDWQGIVYSVIRM